MIERYATFAWTLARPRVELETVDAIRVQVVKEERAGQSHRPDELDEMIAPRAIVQQIMTSGTET